jgi:hypothetical protein
VIFDFAHFSGEDEILQAIQSMKTMKCVGRKKRLADQNSCRTLLLFSSS